MTPTLLATKLYPPPVPRAQVVRPRLSARLDALLHPGARLGLISAATGFGKTTLVSHWLTSIAHSALSIEQAEQASDPYAFSLLSSPPKAAWLSLDAADDEPARFWAYLIGAFQVALPDLASVLDPAQLASLPAELLLGTLLNSLAARPACLLVLDDYHLIESAAIHAGVAFLIAHLPTNMRVVLTSRTDPPLPLARWRARGELVELRAADLRFAPDEAEHFLVASQGLPLAAPEAATLAARTEGWIAGLQLAATALRDQADPARFVAAFAGSHRFVIDYLAEEVLARRPPHIQTFLLHTAILDRMCGPLCDAVIGVAGPEDRPPEAYSQLVLAELERLNLFLVPLDDERCWYRYHHLFAEVLRARLSAGTSPAQRAKLHRRASRWCAQQGLIPEAVDYALRAEDWDEAVALIERRGLATVLGRQFGTFNRWMRRLPAEVARAAPRLLVAQAWEALAVGDFGPIAALLVDAEVALARPGAGSSLLEAEIATIRSAQGLFLGDPQAIGMARRSLERLPADHPAHRPMAGWLGYALLSLGDLSGAADTLATALDQEHERRELRLALLALLGAVRKAQGQLRASVAHYREALQVSTVDGALLPVPGATMALAGLGMISLERDQLDAAEQHLREALALARQHDNQFLVQMIGYNLGQLQEAHGDQAGALAAVTQALAQARQHGVAPVFLHEIDSYRTLLLIRLGRLEEAANGLQAHPPEPEHPLAPTDYSPVAHVCLLLAQGRHDEAGREIKALRAAAEPGGQGRFTLWAAVLEARRLYALGNLPAACAALDVALALAEPEGFARVFLNEGAPMLDLLAAYVERGGAHRTYAERLLRTEPIPASTAAPQPSARSPQLFIEPISEREIEVLRLVAAGHSNQQIAEDLIIALGTVKKHINNIYGKLAVGSRTQALARARELGLL